MWADAVEKLERGSRGYWGLSIEVGLAGGVWIGQDGVRRTHFRIHLNQCHLERRRHDGVACWSCAFDSVLGHAELFRSLTPSSCARQIDFEKVWA